MLQRVYKVREAYGRHQQDRHLHREPRTDEDADETEKTSIGDREVPEQEVERGEWFAWHREKDSEGNERKRQRDEGAFERVTDAEIGKYICEEQEEPG